MKPVAAALAELARLSPNNKAAIGKNGWLYLINDTNSFLHYQFGVRRWSEVETAAAAELIEQRISRIRAMGAQYIKMIQPERSIIYKEFLPEPICYFDNHESRPAQILAKIFPGNVQYPETAMKDLKSFGNIFFRGDTHINWTGSFILYRFIIDQLVSSGYDVSGEAINLADMKPSIASYGGDLYDQMTSAQRAELSRSLGPYNPRFGVEDLIEYQLNDQFEDYTIVDDDGTYAAYNERPLIITERPNTKLPSAVVFRGSSLTHVIPMLARHFARCVFVWHKNLPYAEIIRKEKPDIVLHVIAERFVWDTAVKEVLYEAP